VYGHITVDDCQRPAGALDKHESAAEEFFFVHKHSAAKYEQCLSANIDCTRLPASIQAAFMACTD
jgi:hypothetical protein